MFSRRGICCIEYAIHMSVFLMNETSASCPWCCSIGWLSWVCLPLVVMKAVTAVVCCFVSILVPFHVDELNIKQLRIILIIALNSQFTHTTKTSKTCTNYWKKILNSSSIHIHFSKDLSRHRWTPCLLASVT